MISGEAKETLRELIRGYGFDAVRFTNLEPLENNRLKEWVNAGYHADMEWLKRSVEKRLDPQLVLDEACSVVMLGVNYLPNEASAAKQKGFAKYSLYLDYHDTVLKGVRAIGALLESEYGLGRSDYRCYVDTGPVMERGWAAASGMGWQGKNGMLISKEHGNWLLLATVLLKLEVEPDEPLKKGLSSEASSRSEQGLLCGKCTRCMDACPTGAIVEAGMVDTRLCISYQTIENKGAIPRELRSKMGGRVYGCDICLDVCPWNRFAEAGRMQLLETRYGVGELSLLELLRMDIEQFREVFRKMPVKRTKLRGLKRNACVAAGNLLDCVDPDSELGYWWADGVECEAFLKEVVGELVKLAERDAEAIVRGSAVWAVYRLRGDAAGELLEVARSREVDEGVLAEYGWG